MAFNFDFLRKIELFSSFSQIAVDAEKIHAHNPTYCALGCRRALEASLRWLYSVEKSLKKPYDTQLVQLLDADCFRDFLPYPGMWAGLNFVRKLGNSAAHSTEEISPSRAKIALRNLYAFFDFLAQNYCPDHTQKPFNPALLVASPMSEKPAMTLSKTPVPAQDVFDAENEHLRERLSTLRPALSAKYIEPKSDVLSEAETRTEYIDVMLEEAGWTKGKDWRDEYELEISTSASGRGYADYVLFDDRGLPLAVIEAKRTSVGVEVGRIQAREYADALERKFGRRPIIFLTNGYETRIWADRHEPERSVSGIYSKNDLEWMIQKFSQKRELERVPADTRVAGRDYQLGAIKSVCETFEKGRRKALLVMATGSGKTRVSAALTDLLVRANWARHILFLADRTELVRQAKNAFTQYVKDLTTTNLADDGKIELNARVVFSTYQTMINAIDAFRDENGGRLFSCGHFDLIILDEAHRSIYNKYKDIFRFFDARIVGLTATPRDDIEKSTYDEFDISDGAPTFAYELAQAVRDKYLVPFKTRETKTRFLEEGICYDDLSSDEKEIFEETFDSRDDIGSSALNSWVFNRDTIRAVLQELLRYGLHTDYGNTLGKTIIFAKNHNHAEAILDVWNKDFSEFPQGFCTVIDNQIKHASKLIDDFKKPGAFPQIVISVDMMDTGIDVPEVLNLVFFKTVRSRSKFWQMIGRGTRLCPNLLDGNDKTHFLIFDFCGNFEFFNVHKNGVPAQAVETLSEKLFKIRLELCREFQNLSYKDNIEANRFRIATIRELQKQVADLERKNFSVKLNLKAVENFSEPQTYETLNDFKLEEAKVIAPLLPRVDGDPIAAGFDAFMFRWALGAVKNDKDIAKESAKSLRKKTRALAELGSIPEVQSKAELITRINSEPRYFENATFAKLEEVRLALRDLIKYLSPEQRRIYTTNFEDTILPTTVNESPALADGGNLENYRAKMEVLIRNNQETFVIRKLRTNQPLTATDLTQLEKILLEDKDVRADYKINEGEKPLGVFVREIIGLDENAARNAFADFINDTTLTSEQRYFIETLVRYIVKNGVVSDMRVLQKAPFDELGNLGDIFENNMLLWEKLRSRINSVYNSACAGASL